MALDFIDTFMASIRRLESGNFAGNYSAQGTKIPSGMYAGERAYGAYQIMPGNWSAWAAEAGIPGADMRDKAAQDRVAKYKFTQYYNKYQDWGLVAIAWFAGGGRADTAMKNGVGAVAGIKDANGYSVADYYRDTQKYMKYASDAGYGPDMSRVNQVSASGMLDPQAQAGTRSEMFKTPYFGGGGNVPVPPEGDATAALTPGSVDFAQVGMPAYPSVEGFAGPQEPAEEASTMKPLLIQMMTSLSDLVAGGRRVPVGTGVAPNRIILDNQEGQQV